MSQTDEDDWDEEVEEEDEPMSEPEDEESEADDDDDEEPEDAEDDDLEPAEDVPAKREAKAPKPAAAPAAKPAAKKSPAAKKPAAQKRRAVADSESEEEEEAAVAPAPKKKSPAAKRKSGDSKGSAPAKKAKKEESESEDEEPPEDDDDDDEAAAPAKPLAPSNAAKPAVKEEKKGPRIGDARSEIEHLLVTTNRPYGVNDVVQALAPRYDKGVVQSMLDGLERQGLARSKAVVGAQKAYWPDQAKIQAATAQDLRDMFLDARDAANDAKDAEQAAAAAERRAAAILAAPATEDLARELEETERAVAALEGRLRRSAAAKPATAREMKSGIKKHNEWRAAWLKRKRGFRECVDILAENMDMKPKAVTKAVADAQDIETDEDAGVALPPPDALPVPK
mmetsp:Transcript_14361/g.42880  ORF Transcript_14361/g.42880 Transcript_14361/m.42880 type:complete len:396 (+) Transcript_14361:130-1317(+)|eukprot:CAMPEP_0119261106 /NCGR_PEP_ID=MMETSP1329-20130426/1259_1 /TAXON_ID=114041 /ORGANISM="Genus nov. species nov., Strain RCC1024" /LENGTH=395 /DNA_ID=CAMNT_0007260605 /DNA_START=84 /DNA_END=1271 /DNA_ORIENTATION=+